MNRQEQNWTNLFGEYASNEIAWHGTWTAYDPDKQVIKSDRAIRIFRANEDKTIVTHINRYIRPDGNDEEKIWHIDKEKCNLSDGVMHPAMPWMRALSFSGGATAWLSPKLELGKNFGVEFFFRYENWRTSVAIVYGETGELNRIVQINEHIGSFADRLPIRENIMSTGNWHGEKQSMTPDLKISPPEKIQQWMFDATEAFSLPDGVILTIPQTVQLGKEIAIAATKQVADNEFKRLTARYDRSGALVLLVSEVLNYAS